MQKHHNMTFDEIVKEVVRVCKNNKVEHLSRCIRHIPSGDQQHKRTNTEHQPYDTCRLAVIMMHHKIVQIIYF